MAIAVIDLVKRSPLRSPLFWKLYALYFVAVAATTALVGVRVDKTVDRTAFEREHAMLLWRTQMMAHLFESFLARAQAESHAADDTGFPGKLSELAAAIDTRLTLIGADGRVLADSTANTAV